VATRAEVQERAVQTAKRVKSQVQTSSKELQRGFHTSVEANPLLFAGLALGAGFVAGGGLKAAVGRPLMRVGGSLAWKLLVLPAITATLTRLVGGDSDDEDTD
jgi:hypothetical protein